MWSSITNITKSDNSQEVPTNLHQPFISLEFVLLDLREILMIYMYNKLITIIVHEKENRICLK